jgi:predicted acylesterase/phospholipase RssA/CRP-like cAMP-binding protein
MDAIPFDSNSLPEGFDLAVVWKYFGSTVEMYRDLLEPAFYTLQLAANERLIHRGEVGDALYIVLAGRLKVVAEKGEGENILAFIEPGEGVGEVAFLTGARRTASVDAVTETRLLAMSKQSMTEITEKDPEAGRVLNAALRRHVHQAQLNHVFVMTNIFQDLNNKILHDLKAELELMTVSSGDTIMRSGDVADALYIVISGRLRVVSQDSDGEAYSVDTSRGQTVGEIGLITGERRTATVFALRDTLLARLSRASFQKLLQQYPQAMLSQFVGPIIARLRDERSGNAVKTSDVSVIAITAVDHTVPLAEFTMKFTEALGCLGSTKHLNSKTCAFQFGAPDIAYLAEDDPKNDYFVFWLNEEEATQDYVVYEADYELTRWTERCIRQADLVLIVGNASSSPQRSEIESRLLADTDNLLRIQCLVLLQEDEVQLPVRTQRWLEPRKIRSHYHVRMGEEADFSRISRLITGRGVGLVLSGGGARALAHIGVIRALEEHGVPIDAIGAVSAGSIVAGLWAMGLENSEIVQRSTQANDRVDYTLPLHALTSGRNWTKAMKRLFGDLMIEDLWWSFFCISANLTQGQLLVHESGSLMHAVRASTAIPGILPPVFHDGNVLVDGGLMNNLPTDLMSDHPDIGYVIAVDVAMADSENRVIPFDYAISGWKSLWRRINPWNSEYAIPTISEILMRSISITNALSAKVTKRLVDRYFEPPVRAYGLLDYDKIDELVAIGYDYARQEIAEDEAITP